MPSDLWPDDITNVTGIAPVTILKQQASLLSRKTKNVVEGKVAPISQEPWTYSDGFAYSFNIVAPALGYEYRLLAITHRIDYYPLLIKPDDRVFSDVVAKLGEFRVPVVPNRITTNAFRAKTQDDFEAILKVIFESQKARRVVESLLAQSGFRQPAPA